MARINYSDHGLVNRFKIEHVSRKNGGTIAYGTGNNYGKKVLPFDIYASYVVELNVR